MICGVGAVFKWCWTRAVGTYILIVVFAADSTVETGIIGPLANKTFEIPSLG